MCVDVTDNELAYLESVHLFVEILDHYFSNVCELDLVFNFHKVGSQVFNSICMCRKPCKHLLLVVTNLTALLQRNQAKCLMQHMPVCVVTA